MEQERIETIANELSDLVNNMLCKDDCEKLVEKMVYKHRTLQQSTMRYIIIPLIKQWANFADKGWYDDRNEQTVMLCKRLIPIIEKSYLPHI